MKSGFLFFILFLFIIASCAHPKISQISDIEKDRFIEHTRGTSFIRAISGFARLRLSNKGRSLGLQANIAIGKPDRLYAEVLKSLQPVFLVSIQGEEMKILDPNKGVLYEGKTSEELGRLSLMDLNLHQFLEALSGSLRQEQIQILSGTVVDQKESYAARGLWDEVQVERDFQNKGFRQIAFLGSNRELLFKDFDQKPELLARNIRFSQGKSRLEVFWKNRSFNQELDPKNFLLPEGQWKRLSIESLDGLPGL